MWRKSLFCLHSQRNFLCSTSSSIPTVHSYSFLHPSLFGLKWTPPPPNPNPTSPPQTLTLDQQTALESTLSSSLTASDTDKAWKSFRTLTNNYTFPSKHLTNSLITHLSSFSDAHNLKRAFASVVFLVEKNPKLLDFDSVRILLNAMCSANTYAPAFSLISRMLKNRFFVPFSVWGSVLLEICRKSGSFVAFLRVFDENCRIALDEKLDFMKPDLEACNAALIGCCCNLESVSDAESVVEKMSLLDVLLNESSFGLLAYLYALKGLEEKVIELEGLMGGLDFSNRNVFFRNLIGGYAKSGNLESLSGTMLRSLREGDGQDSNFGHDTYCALVKGFLRNESIKELAILIIEAQKLDATDVTVAKSFGFGIANALVNIGSVSKAHSILVQMKALGGSAGLGVYMPIVKAYYKEQQTAEAARLVTEICSSKFQLDVESYDDLIEASMLCQDFISAVSLFRDMREARIPDLKRSYLTIMTGLTENNRPELMAAFLDEVAEDPRVKVGTQDWNSIVHAFCKVGRMEDARKTLTRMNFLRFEPNEQTYLSLVKGYATAEKYFEVLMLWHRVKSRFSSDGVKGIKLDQKLIDPFLYALVKGGYFDSVMQIVEKCRQSNLFLDKWRYKHAFMENLKDLKGSKLRRNLGRMGALSAFKDWVGLNA